MDDQPSPSPPPPPPPLLVPIQLLPVQKTIHFPIFKRKEKVPITILTGFLGAGKSTLLRRILTENHSLKIAVLLNEIGDDVQVEKRIYQQQIKNNILHNNNNNPSEEEDEENIWLQVDNGCLCCTAKTECTMAIETLLKKSKTPIDHIIIECSGAVDPSRLLEQLWMDEELEMDICLDGVICLIDYSTLNQSLSSPLCSLTFSKQIASADLSLINRFPSMLVNTDLIKSINPFSKIVFDDCFCIANLFSLNEYRNHHQQQNLPLEDLLNSSLIFDNGHKHQHSNIRSFTVTIGKCFPSLREFEYFLFTLLWEGQVGLEKVCTEEEGECIIRIKGIIRVLGDSEYGIQVVRELYDITKLTTNTSDRSALIFIGLMSQKTEDLIRKGLILLL